MGLASWLFVIAGGSLVLLAGVGVLRFGDLYARMHSATKATTVGFLLVCVGASLELGMRGWKALLAAAFVLVTTPCAAHFVARCSYGAKNVPVRIEGPDDLGRLVESSGERGE
ncbi:MAG: Na+/H+ antiporter subunit G [Acidimicrobiales bacterium]|nr:MAG: Na+/H+ antiporter subunit G [Acidimicrobiales bacterium]